MFNPFQQSATDPFQPETGMYLRDLLTDPLFVCRFIPGRDPDRKLIALHELSELADKDEQAILQHLVDVAVEFCDADSAGISLEDPETATFQWVAIAGSFTRYIDGRTPRNYSPCGICLDSGRPQLYYVTQPYYDFLGVTAAPITDGILIPWSNVFAKGTLWCVSHTSTEAFDRKDYEFLSTTAEAVSHVLRQRVLHTSGRR